MLKYTIIVNPAANRGRNEQNIPCVSEILKTYRLDYEIIQTQRPWHAAELARKAAKDGTDVVVAMGGDGTANEVINGLMQAKSIDHCQSTLGVLSTGQGNDFAYGIGIPKDLKQGCQVLAQGQKRYIDIGYVVVNNTSPGRYFGNGIGIGFDAIVGFEAKKMKQLSGFLCYAIAACKTLFLYYKPPLVKIAYSGQTKIQSSLMISIMNGRRMGGGFKMAPASQPDDSLFDLCIAGKVSRLRILKLIFHFMRGTQVGKRSIHMDRTSSLEVTAIEGSLPAHADGETLAERGKSLSVKLLPKSLETLYAG